MVYHKQTKANERILKAEKGGTYTFRGKQFNCQKFLIGNHGARWKQETSNAKEKNCRLSPQNRSCPGVYQV